MSKINLLSEDIINKIAAGEVIERPASVVKELVENSLDAGASSIFLEIKDSGKELIKVSDNGEGMSEEDARKSLLRHATSKITFAEDLFSIKTLGFRGEALASIAAVSQLSLTTRQKDDLAGFNIAVEGGEIISTGVIGAEQGTTIEVHKIFFNVPARKKFLKSDAVELSHIIDTVIRYALANPKVHFKLIHEGHTLVKSPAVEDSRSKIASLYGIETAKELLEVSYANEEVIIKGFISKPYQARNDKEQQTIFVNSRWIRNNDISKAIYDAYHSTLFVNKHPVFVLNLEINPEKIDVNVHPQKQEIKIEQKDNIYKAVFSAIRETLEKNNLLPVLDFKIEQQLAFGTDVTPNKGTKPFELVSQQASERRTLALLGEAKTSAAKPNARNAECSSPPTYAFDQSSQTVLPEEEKNKELNLQGEEINEKENETAKINAIENGPEEKEPAEELSQSTDFALKLPPLKVLGQLNRTFFVAETPGGVLFIDQHVVQERVLYEKFMQEYMNKKVSLQNLLQAEIIEFTPAQKVLAEENLSVLEQMGFKLEPFGENTFSLKTVPTIFGRLQPKELLFEIISSLSEKGLSLLEEIQEEIITRMACRASVKAGDLMTVPEIQKLLAELSDCNLPYTCPHGRAVLIKMNNYELEKKFRRR